MSGLAAGLARGLAMYGQGRMIAEDREAERQRQEAERQRQMAMMKLQQEQFALQREQFEAGQRQTALTNKRVAETDTNEAIGKGFRPVGDQWDTFNDLVGIDPSKAETITVNGQTMRKVAPTQAFQQGIIQRREQDTALQQQAAEQNRMLETIRAQLPKAVRPLAVDLKTAQTLLGKYAEQRMAPPKAGPAPLTQVGGDGNMYYSTDGGRSWNVSRVNGAPDAPIDAPAPQSVPMASPRAALDTIPGSGFSSAAPPVSAAQPPQRQPAAPRSGPFGKSGTAAGLPTADELKAAGFAQRMEQSAQAIADFESKGTSAVRDPAARAVGILPLVGQSMQNSMTDKERQKFWTAADNWIRANLRKESGAVIGTDEMEGERRTYFPMPGDDKETVEFKRQLRQTTENAMRQMAGRAYQPWTPPAQQQSSGGLTALERIYFGGRR